MIVVASLTTIPSRIETSCRLAIDSLLNQVDHVYLSVPSYYKRFSQSIVIPDYFSEEPYKSKVSVVICEDKGPATKYLGALGKIPENSYIFFCDDDQEYCDNLISRMMQSVRPDAVYQNRYSIIQNHTSGGLIHGFVGNLVKASLLKNLPDFPLPDCAYHVDDQWMSIYYFLNNIPIKATGVESYREIYKVLENNHEKLGKDSLASLGTRDARVAELARFFQVKFVEKGAITMV